MRADRLPTVIARLVNRLPFAIRGRSYENFADYGSEQQGIFSHQTALFLHDLSDALPSRAHLTLPTNWRRRRLRIAAGLELHYADVDEAQRSWVGSIPVTAPLRTLADCASTHLSRDLLEQAIQEASTRGIVTRAELQSIGLGADCDERK